MKTDEQKNAAAVELIVQYGGIDGDHHKAWVLDRVVRILTGDRYAAVVAEARAGEDGPETYGWDEGIAPWVVVHLPSPVIVAGVAYKFSVCVRCAGGPPLVRYHAVSREIAEAAVKRLEEM